MSPPEDIVYKFASFSLDSARGALLSAEQTELPLRPKAFALLCLFVSNPERLLDRDTILETIWPKVLVTEDSITQCIREIRAALGDRSQILIRTVRGRGYVLSTSVSVERFPAPGNEPVGRTSAHVHAAIALKAPLDPPRLSLVVLPFANLNDDREQQFIADGITMDLTTELSRIRNALVISSATAFTYRNKPIETSQIARELDVRFVLYGSVQRSGSHLRVNAQLIDGVTDTHVWANRFDRDLGDLTALQDDVVSHIAGALDVELMVAEAARLTERPDAMERIYRGHSLRMQALSRDVYVQRVKWYEQACILDPQSVEALSWLALVLAGRVLDHMSDCVEADLARAGSLVGQALTVSPHNAVAHFARGHWLRALDRWQESIPAYEVAVASNRNWASAIGFLGAAKLTVGLLDEVISLEERAIRLSPRDPQLWLFFFCIGATHMFHYRLEEAIDWFGKSQSHQPNLALPNAYLAAAFALTGETGRAGFHLCEARRLSNRFHSVAALKANFKINGPELAALYERIYFAGLIKAGLPET